MQDLAPRVYYVQVNIEILKQHYARVWMDIMTLLYQNVLNVLINALLVKNPVHIVFHVTVHKEIEAQINVCKYLIIYFN